MITAYAFFKIIQGKEAEKFVADMTAAVGNVITTANF